MTFRPASNPLSPHTVIIGHGPLAATLIHDDAYAALPGLGRFDAMVTDPPYELRTSGGGKFRKDRPQLDAIMAQGLADGFDLSIMNPLQCPAVVTFCHNDQLPTVLPHLAGNWHRFALLTWHKTNPLPMANKHYRPDTEIWLHAWLPGYAPIGSLPEKARFWHGPTPATKDRHGHPTPKPLALMDKIIANVAGQSIVDPFMGTGTTGVAAIRARADLHRHRTQPNPLRHRRRQNAGGMGGVLSRGASSMTDLPKIHNWTARRSGAAMTIRGTDAIGNDMTLTDVSEITADEPFPLATHKDGEQYQLVTVDCGRNDTAGDIRGGAAPIAA
jgi:hypothetical protein